MRVDEAEQIVLATYPTHTYDGPDAITGIYCVYADTSKNHLLAASFSLGQSLLNAAARIKESK